MADKHFHQLFADPNNYPGPRRAYTDLLTDYDGFADANAARVTLHGYTSVFPTMMAFMPDDDPGFIYLGHSPTFYTRTPGFANADLDAHTVVLLGDQGSAVIPYVLPDDFADRHAIVRILDDAADTEAAIVAAGGNFAPHVPGGTANSHEVQQRHYILLPPNVADMLVQGSFRLSTRQFYQRVLQPLVAGGHAATHNILFEWWGAASTRTAAGANSAVVRAFPQPGIASRATLQHWCARLVARQLGPVPTAAGPSLNAVVTAVDGVTTQLQAAEAARVAARAAVTTHSERFGQAVTNLLLRFTRVAAEADLPELHRALASYDKRSRDATTLNLALSSASHHVRAINENNLPKATPYLLDLIRGHNLIGSSFELGEGLSPFSIVCLGHPNTKDVLEVAERQAVVESGSSVSLSDAIQFKTKDARFPRTYLQAVDKLWAFVLFLRVYFGENCPVFRTTLAATETIAPMILQLESYFHANPRSGLLVAIKILLYYQNIINIWLRQARDTAVGTDVPGPDYTQLLTTLRMQSYDLLPRVPDTWMEVIRSQNPELYPPERIRGGGPTSSSAGSPQGASGGPVVNPRPDSGLTSRWRSAQLNAVQDLKGKWTSSEPYAVPKVGNDEICLKYQLTGSCKANCPRKATHKSFGADIVTKLNTFLDTCGVPN